MRTIYHSLALVASLKLNAAPNTTTHVSVTVNVGTGAGGLPSCGPDANFVGARRVGNEAGKDVTCADALSKKMYMQYTGSKAEKKQYRGKCFFYKPHDTYGCESDISDEGMCECGNAAKSCSLPEEDAAKFVSQEHSNENDGDYSCENRVGKRMYTRYWWRNGNIKRKHLKGHCFLFVYKDDTKTTCKPDFENLECKCGAAGEAEDDPGPEVCSPAEEDDAKFVPVSKADETDGEYSCENKVENKMYTRYWNRSQQPARETLKGKCFRFMYKDESKTTCKPDFDNQECKCGAAGEAEEDPGARDSSLVNRSVYAAVAPLGRFSPDASTRRAGARLH